MRTHVALLLVILLTAGLAGCLETPAPTGGDSADTATGADPVVRDPRVPADASSPRVVVAVIDTGINVYHDTFQRPGGLPDDVVSSFVDTATGEPPQRIGISHTGDFDERLEADEPTWNNLTTGQLYYFEGTNVLGISFDDGGTYPVLDVPDGSHGSATSGAVLAANPQAIIVMVESFGPDAEAWAAQQPWIDVVSMSYGPPGSVPFSGRVFGLTTSEATRMMWGNGQIPVGAADNTPSLAPNDETAGPPWVVGVGGDHEEEKCREHVSGTFPDVTSDFTQTLPDADHTSDNHSTSGTSFSTPRTAGTFSQIILEVRRALDHTGGLVDGALAVGPDGQQVTNADVRAAVNRTAYYFDFTECEGGGLLGLPVNPAAPWAQMGWGHVDPTIVPAAVAHVLGLSEAPAKNIDAVAFQTAVHEYRTALWENQP